MAKRKSQRMFTREQRAANRANIGEISRADRQRMTDDAEVQALFGRPLIGGNDAPMIAEYWFELREAGESRYPDETASMRVLERVFLRLTGEALTVSYVEALQDRREQEREEYEFTQLSVDDGRI